MTGGTVPDEVRHVVDDLRRVAEYGRVVLVGPTRVHRRSAWSATLVAELVNRFVYVSACARIAGDVCRGSEGLAGTLPELFGDIPFPTVAEGVQWCGSTRGRPIRSCSRA